MKRRIYIETTVVSYYTARPSRDLVIAARQEETRVLWKKLTEDYETYVSALVYEEAKAGDAEASKKRLDAISPFPVLDIDEQAQSLAAGILQDHAVPEKYPEDAMHIAVAAVNGIDVIVSLNFSHINNPFKRAQIRQSVESRGFVCPEICSPDELMEEEHE
jgi:predicted nucleic acid-binding protein